MTTCRSCSRCLYGERIYLLVIVIGLLTALGFAVYGIVKDHFHTPDSSYLFVFSVNCCFAIIYAVKGMRNEDPYDLAILVLSVAPALIYIIVNYASGGRSDFKLARLILGVIFAPSIAGFGFYYLSKFCKTNNFMMRYGIRKDQERTRSSKATETNQVQQTCLRTMLLFYFLLSVNLQCDISAAVFTLTSGFAVEVEHWTIHHKETFILFFFVICIASLGCMFGHLGVRYERKEFFIAFGIISTCLVGAGLYLLIQAIKDLHGDDTDHTLSGVTLFMAVLMLFIRVISCTGCYLSFQNFGKGLKEAVSVNATTDPERVPVLSQTRDVSSWNKRGFNDSSVQISDC